MDQNATELPLEPPPIERSAPVWRKTVLIRGGVLVGFVIVCWIVVIYDKVAPTQDSLVNHGIIPRQMKGLWGILFSPLIHTGFLHVATNTVGILIVGSILMIYSLPTFFTVTGFVWLFGGFMVWCVARSGGDIVGASCLVFGWFGYIIVTPCFTRPLSIKGLALAVLAGVLYGGLLFGVFPKDPRITWEATICGLISGVCASMLYWVLYLRYIRRRFLNRDPNNPGETTRLLDKNQDVHNYTQSVAMAQVPERASFLPPTTDTPISSAPSHSHTPAWLSTQPVNNKENQAMNPDWLVPNDTASNDKQSNADPFSFINKPTQTSNNNNNVADEIFNPFIK